MRQRAVLFLAAVFPLYAEQGVLVARVKDIYRRAMPGLQLSAEGAAISAPTDAAGIARIPLPAQTQAGARVSLQLIKPPRDLTFISPWDEQIAVPRFDRAKEVPIMPADRGDRALPEDGPALASLTANVLKRIQPSPKNEPAGNAQRRHEAMIEVSRTYGLSPEDLDKAIRAWGEKSDDPYEKGLAALYEERYPEASLQLQKSLAKREAEPDKARDELADAEPLYRRALAIAEKALGPDHTETRTIRQNLAAVLEKRGR